MPRKTHPANSANIITFMAEYGRAYLGSGGPTSRLEEALTQLGKKIGFPTEIYATPTGIFVSCMDAEGKSHTTLSRIKDTSINLGKLCWLEGIFEDVFSGKISISQANKILHSKAVQKPLYAKWKMFVAGFLAGFALSYPAFQNFFAAIASGLIAMATWWVAGPGLKPRINSAIFRDFIGAAVTLTLASLCQLLMPAPFEAFTIGGLVILVPGLSLTAAISELADQNLLSGTAKLMQAILTLLALGLAYLLFQELSDTFGLASVPSAMGQPLSMGFAGIGMALSVACFGILFSVPPKSLPWAALTGLIAWSILRLFSSTHHIASASFLASFAVGAISLWLGGRFRVPSQVFSVPGILAMLPGMLALTSMRSFTMGQQSSGITFGFNVALIAGSIVFGLFTARIPFAFRLRYRREARE